MFETTILVCQSEMSFIATAKLLRSTLRKVAKRLEDAAYRVTADELQQLCCSVATSDVGIIIDLLCVVNVMNMCAILMSASMFFIYVMFSAESGLAV